MSKTLGITGHRPQKLYGFEESHPGNLFIIYAIGNYLKEFKPTKVITGMALGADQWAAQWCIQLSIPFVAATPFKGQDRIWPEPSKKKYKYLLNRAEEIEIVSKTYDNIGEALNSRNKWIVDNSDTMLGVFGGYAGGTKNCLEYAKSKNKKIDIINPGDYYKAT